MSIQSEIKLCKYCKRPLKGHVKIFDWDSCFDCLTEVKNYKQPNELRKNEFSISLNDREMAMFFLNGNSQYVPFNIMLIDGDKINFRGNDMYFGLHYQTPGNNHRNYFEALDYKNEFKCDKNIRMIAIHVTKIIPGMLI